MRAYKTDSNCLYVNIVFEYKESGNRHYKKGDSQKENSKK